jgi:dihydropteroate synthase
MGIINSTPDSFYAGSRFSDPDAILREAEKMLLDGADLLDIGGQSSRPGAEQAGPDEELRRIIAPITALVRRFPDLLLSVDTWHSKVAKEAVAAGASLVNDISGGQLDQEMLDTVGRLGIPYICMHMKGEPATMSREAIYGDVTKEVLDFFTGRIEDCRKAGIHDVILDPGLGFAKNPAHNFQLLKDLAVFKMTGKPILLGISRKSTIYKTLGITAGQALNGTTVLNTIAVLHGADILRVHDPKEAREVITLLGAYGMARGLS